MKAIYKFIIMSGLFILGCTTIVPAVAQEPTEAGKTELTVTGTVRDRETRKKLENVTIALAGTSIGTVTNAEGVFSLKINDLQSAPQLELSHIGYQNTRFSATAPEGSARPYCNHLDDTGRSAVG